MPGRQHLLSIQPSPGAGGAGQRHRPPLCLTAQEVQLREHPQQERFRHDGPEQGVVEELVGVVGDRAGVEVHGRAGFPQVLHPIRQQIVLPGHDSLRGGTLPLPDSS